MNGLSLGVTPLVGIWSVFQVSEVLNRNADDSDSRFDSLCYIQS